MSYESNASPRALWIAAAIFCAAVITDSWFRWTTFQYGTADLASYVQALWGMGHGVWTPSLLDMPLMGNHAEPVMFLFRPFYWIWPHPMMLVVMQTLLLATLPFTAWRIARRMEFDRGSAQWLALVTLVMPGTAFVALHEFHAEALAAPFLLLMLEARHAKRPGLYWLWFVLAAMCGENAALTLGWMGVVHWFLERERGKSWQRTFNVVPAVLALGWAALYVLWLSPKWNGGRVDYGELYSGVNSLGSAVSAAWRGATGGTLVWGTLLPLLALPLLRPQWMLVAAPIFAQHLLSSRSPEWSLSFHHAAPLLPLLWYGAAEACEGMFWRETLSRWLLIASAACFAWIGPAKRVAETWSTAGEAWAARGWKKELLAQIPPDAGVTASLPFVSHLAQRSEVHSLQHVIKGLRSPGNTLVTVLDPQDATTFDKNSGSYHGKVPGKDGRVLPHSDLLLHDHLRGTTAAKAINSVTIYSRAGAPLPPQRGEGRKFDGAALSLVSAVADAAGAQPVIRLTWDCGEKRTFIPWLQLVLQGPDGVIRAWTKGPIAPGIERARWSEDWELRRGPAMPPGKYEARLVVFDPLPPKTPGETPPFEKCVLSLGSFEWR